MSELIKRINDIITYIKTEEIFSREEIKKLQELQIETYSFLTELVINKEIYKTDKLVELKNILIKSTNTLVDELIKSMKKKK